MGIAITYQSRRYSPLNVTGRYVRFDGEEFRFAEVGLHCLDVRQGTVDETDLPVDVAQEARAKAHLLPNYVEWPLILPPAPHHKGGAE